MAFAAPVAHGQAVFQPVTANTTATVGSSPQGVAVADLDRDGKPDAVVANSKGNSLSVLLSSKNYAATTVHTGGRSTPVAVAVLPDFAYSGLPAVAVVEQGSSEVAIYKDSTAGALTLDTTYTVGSNPTAIALGDFNNDGIPDLAVTYPGGVTILLGSANGTFNPGTGVSVGTNLVAIAVGHFTGVKNADLAVVDQASNKVYVLTGSGNGSFAVGNSYAVGTKPTSVAVADFNHDGNMDLAVGNYTSGSVSVLLGNGSGVFTAASGSPFAAGSNVQSLIVSDINSDGAPDIVVTNAANGTTGNTVSVLLGVGNGTFQGVLSPALSGSPYGLASLDFNRDGKPDILVTQNTANTVSVMLNNTLLNALPGGRNFQAATQIGAGNMADAVVTADFNGDGIPDVAVAYLEDGTVGVMLGKGDGTFQAQTLYTVGYHPYAIAAADLNHDGSPDLVAVNESNTSKTGTVSVLLNNGNGTFASAANYNVGWLPTGVAIGDLNNDGIPDLAVTNYGSNNVSILMGKGDGTFTPGPTPTLAGQTNPYGVVIGDFNGDGNQDVAFTNFKSATLEVYLGNGDGSFQSPSTDPTNATPTGIVAADFNRDGKMDIAVGDAYANNISIFLGNGSGGFTASTVTSLNFPVSLAVGDVNGDGIPDIVNSDPNFNKVTVLLGNGDGTFTARWQFPTASGTSPSTPGAQPWGVALADFNLDGKLDIVTANTYARINLTIPAYQPASGATLGSPASTSILLNNSGVSVSLSTNPSGSNISDTAPVTLTAQVVPALSGVSPTGSVVFEDTNGTPMSNAPVPLSSGSASVTLQNIGSGTHILSALYSGDVNYQPNTVVNGNAPLGVSGTRVTLGLSPSTMPFGGTFTATITVYGTNPNVQPTGNVSLYVFTPQGFEAGTSPSTFNFTSCSGDVCYWTGQISDPNGVLSVGVYNLYATYNPGNYPAGTSQNEQLTIVPDQTSISDFCYDLFSYGECDASVSSAQGTTINSGNVYFSVNGLAPIAEPVSNGSASLTNINFNDGNNTVVATYPAQGNYGASSTTTTFHVSCGFFGCFGYNAVRSPLSSALPGLSNPVGRSGAFPGAAGPVRQLEGQPGALSERFQQGNAFGSGFGFHPNQPHVDGVVQSLHGGNGQSNPPGAPTGGPGLGNMPIPTPNPPGMPGPIQHPLQGPGPIQPVHPAAPIPQQDGPGQMQR
jgi:hypothetical protein